MKTTKQILANAKAAGIAAARAFAASDGLPRSWQPDLVRLCTAVRGSVPRDWQTAAACAAAEGFHWEIHNLADAERAAGEGL